MRIAIFSAIVAICGISGADANKVSASRHKVDTACQNSGGIGWGTSPTAKGSYGCITDYAWISCTSKGKCEGKVVEAAKQ